MDEKGAGMRTMTDSEFREFLTASPHTGKLATVSAQGQPHVVPIWFVLERDELVLTISSASAKARNLRANQRVCMCVEDEQPPYAFVSVFGRASVSPSPPDLLEWTTRIAERYVGPERSVEFGQRNAALDDLVVRVSMDRVIAYAEVIG
jgi:PPOX class probable F420-dependent enzyme